MKRVFTLALVLCLAVSLCTVAANAKYSEDPNHLTTDTANNTSTAGKPAAMGDTTGTLIGSREIPVKLQTISGGGTIHVYAVSFSTTEVTFTWSNTASTIWNPETLKYETQNDNGSWQAATQKITVNNYSDVAIKVEADNAAPTSSDNGVTLSVDGPLELASAYDNTAVGSVKSGDITVTVSGTPNVVYPNATEIAAFTLNVTRQTG